MKAQNLQKAQHMKWMLKVRNRSKDFVSLLGIQSMADVVGHGRLRWFEHLECKNVDDWVLKVWR